MKKLTITFGKPEDVTHPGADAVEYSFPFAIVESDLQGTPAERAATKHQRVLVSISRTRRAGWRLSPEETVKILFWFGKRHVSQLVTARSLPTEYTIRLPMITTTSHPGDCQFDPAAIPPPDGFMIFEEQPKPRIGF